MMRLPAEKDRGVTPIATGERVKLAVEMKTATATVVLCFKCLREFTCMDQGKRRAGGHFLPGRGNPLKIA
jgi:hypothetical protein